MRDAILVDVDGQSSIIIGNEDRVGLSVVGLDARVSRDDLEVDDMTSTVGLSEGLTADGVRSELLDVVGKSLDVPRQWKAVEYGEECQNTISRCVSAESASDLGLG